MSSQPIVVTGANGNVGAPLVEALIQRALPVRAAVHSQETALTAEAKTVHFDFENEETWKSAFRDARGLFVLRPPHLSNVERSIHPALDTASESGVEHVVTLSVMGLGPIRFCRTAESKSTSNPSRSPGRTSGPDFTCRT